MARLLLTVLMFAFLALHSSPAAAQFWPGGAGSGQRTLPTSAPTAGDDAERVISTNPLGLMFRLFNFEYEARVSEAVTAGVGATHVPTWVGLGGSYTNGDIFIRYYPGGRALHGVSLDLKTGLTTLGGDGLAAGAGFDVNATQWLNDRVVLSAGLGLKRVFAGADSFVLPTIRIFNVGIGF